MRRLTGPRKLAVVLAYVGAWLAVTWLDAHAGLTPAAHHDAFIGVIIAIGSAIAAGIEAAGAAVAFALQVVVHALWVMVIALSHAVAEGIWAASRFLGRALDYLKLAWDRGLKPFLQWSYNKLQALELWTKAKLAPVLEFIGKVKARIDGIYQSFVRPIVDVIDYIRQLNRILLAFHVDLLQGLDAQLARLEARIEQPFLWVRDKINWLEGWIDRIVTFDGLLQRLTLMRSLFRDHPLWMRLAVNARTKPLTGAQAYLITRATEVPDVAQVVEDLRRYYQTGSSDGGAIIDKATDGARGYYENA